MGSEPSRPSEGGSWASVREAQSRLCQSTHDDGKDGRVELIAERDASDLNRVEAGRERPPPANNGGDKDPGTCLKRVAADRTVQAGEDEQRQQAVDAEDEDEVRGKLARPQQTFGPS